MKVNITKHGYKRIAQRKITSEEIKSALMFGTCTINDSTTQKYEYADLKIITGLENQIITVWRYSANKDTRFCSRRARIQYRQRLIAMRMAEHNQEMRRVRQAI